jgi:hypothetical protein
MLPGYERNGDAPTLPLSPPAPQRGRFGRPLIQHSLCEEPALYRIVQAAAQVHNRPNSFRARYIVIGENPATCTTSSGLTGSPVLAT